MNNKSRSWDDCKNFLFSKKSKPDHELIKSLMESAGDRQKTASMLPVTEVTKETVFTLFYDSLREYLEALALSKGYKIYSHECFYYFLKEEMMLGSFAEIFNSLRLLRNKINYYGKKLSLESAYDAISLAKNMIKQAKRLPLC